MRSNIRIQEIFETQRNALLPQNGIGKGSMEKEERNREVEQRVLRIELHLNLVRNIEIRPILLMAIELLRFDAVKQLNGLITPLDQLLDGVLLVLPHFALDASQTEEGLLSDVRAHLYVEGKRAHVFNKRCIRDLGSFVAVVRDGFLENTFDGHHALAEQGDTGVIEGGAGHCEEAEVFGFGWRGMEG